MLRLMAVGGSKLSIDYSVVYSVVRPYFTSPPTNRCGQGPFSSA